VAMRCFRGVRVGDGFTSTIMCVDQNRAKNMFGNVYM
jgi:hypothetical protein